MEKAMVFLAAFCTFRLSLVEPSVRDYYIAAVEIGWDYTESAAPETNHKKIYKNTIQKYIKAVYREYTDSTYTIPKPRPAWSGIQGPMIVAQAGDRVVVHFKNLASQPYSISPVGATYWKQSEGEGYEDSTAGQEKEDDAVFPGGYYEYVWDISIKDGPTRSDPECLTYSYSSRVDTVRDMNSGLIGSLLICKPNAFTEDGNRRNPAFVLLFAVFDESQSWYGEAGERRSRENFRKSNTRKEYHTINGYINSTLPGLTLCHGRGNVFWHLIGVGTAPAIHTIQFHEHTLQVLSHRKITVEITPMTFITAEMKPTSVGHFLITCNIVAHRHAGMNALFTVETCPEVVLPEQRNAKYKDYGDSDNYDYEYDQDLFNAINIEAKNPKVRVRSSRGRVPKTWHHYIAAEEIIWNYAPHLKHTDIEMQSPYLPKVPHHLDYKYKKVVYVEYSDESFTKRVSPPNTLLGPLLKGKVNDQFHITFKNLASRPFNIYPNGLTKIYPLKKNANDSNLQTMGVLPNTTFGYIWKLTAEDGPLDGDPQCLTQFYQSTVSPERDLATGLVGTLLICKYDAIDSNGRLLSPDRELSLIFAIFDENRSWCFEENMIKLKQLTLSNNTDSEFYKSNVIHSVNGIMFSGRQFVMCQTDVTFWHIANVGTQSDFLSVYFTGNLFEFQGVHQSVLTLFPMTATTVSMETELNGEWEISAFDSSHKSRGMSIFYSVLPCNSGKLPTVDQDEEEDVSDYLDFIDFGPRGSRPLNQTITVRVCKKRINATRFETKSTNKALRCQLKNITVAELKNVKAKKEPEEEIPLDILKETGVHIDSEHPQVRLKRQTDGNWTEDDLLSEEITGRWELNVQDLESQNLSSTTLMENNQISSGIHSTKYDPEGDNEILLDPTDSMESETKELLNDLPTNIENQTADFNLEFKNNTENDNLTNISLSVDYDEYSQEENGTDTFYSGYLDMRSGEMRSRHYYIAAEETTWNYGIRTPHQFIKAREMRRGMRKFLPEYKKVIFRAYKDKDFQWPVPRGELEEHLGIMGPFIRAEINELLTVVFKNKASRPYSFHLQGVYDRSQGAGLGQTHASDSPPGVPGDPVAPGEARTYYWRTTKQQGPSDKELSCKTGAYYSTLDKDRDLQSGLVGPLVICKPGTLQTGLNRQPDVQEFALLFHTFDETRSWYLEENLQEYCVPPCQYNRADPWFYTSNSFASINGYVAETLPGLLVAQHQLVRWHLLNLGSDGEYHAVHFHSLPFIVHTGVDHRKGVYQLFPGVFGTLEMRPPTVGTWLVECTVADYQLAGMRAKVLVYNPKCILPLGMKSRRIHDSQITASNHFDGWEPRLARLDQSGFINAWMGRGKMLWIQVDLLKPMLLHGVKTQGVRAKLKEHYVTHFTVSYSMDLETWTHYRGNSTMRQTCLFFGNMDSVKVKENTFFPPFVARYIRIHPVNFVKMPALRMELLGCDVNSCSLPLGLQTRQIPDSNFSASSVHSSLFSSWSPFLARLHQDGHANAWRPKNNNPHEWLQVDLGKVRRIAGVVTQGARSLLTQMMVTEFSVTVSQDGRSWSSVLEEDSQRDKIFIGNNDPEEEALTVFDYPLFGRYLRIHPLGWINDIALRLEVLGCDTQQLP